MDVKNGAITLYDQPKLWDDLVENMNNALLYNEICVGQREGKQGGISILTFEDAMATFTVRHYTNVKMEIIGAAQEEVEKNLSTYVVSGIKKAIAQSAHKKIVQSSLFIEWMQKTNNNNCENENAFLALVLSPSQLEKGPSLTSSKSSCTLTNIHDEQEKGNTGMQDDAHNLGAFHHMR